MTNPLRPLIHALRDELERGQEDGGPFVDTSTKAAFERILERIDPKVEEPDYNDDEKEAFIEQIRQARTQVYQKFPKNRERQLCADKLTEAMFWAKESLFFPDRYVTVLSEKDFAAADEKIKQLKQIASSDAERRMDAELEQLNKEVDTMDEASVRAHYVATMANWSGTLDEVVELREEVKKLREDNERLRKML
jgi:hypothetical protein